MAEAINQNEKDTKAYKSKSVATVLIKCEQNIKNHVLAALAID
jgi:hypothetical protein